LLTVAVLVEDIFQISALFVTQACLFLVRVLREGSEDCGLGVVGFSTNHVILAVFGQSTKMMQPFNFRLAEAILRREIISAQATLMIVIVLNTRGLSDSRAVGVGRAFPSLRCAAKEN
jgi:hypothetical protein